jgi:hypothetical protein
VVKFENMAGGGEAAVAKQGISPDMDFAVQYGYYDLHPSGRVEDEVDLGISADFFSPPARNARGTLPV